MKIAICDDDPKDLGEIQAVLAQYDTASAHTILSYSKASDLFLASQSTPFDIAILDIEMESPNGYEVAQKLAEQKHPPLIIFLTNSSAYAVRGYGIAFRYLTKPIVKDHLYSALDRAICEIKANRFMFTAEGQSHIIPMKDIYYFEVFNHHTVMHTVDSSFTFRSSLREITEQLPSGYFGSPHKSYLVNLMHIESTMSGDLQLTNGAVIPVSRRRQTEFQKQLYHYLGR